MLPVIFKSGFMVYIYIYLFFFVFLCFCCFWILGSCFFVSYFFDVFDVGVLIFFCLTGGMLRVFFFFVCVCVWERKLCNSRDETERSSRCQIYGHGISALWSNPFVNLAINLPVYGSFY